MDHTQTEAPVLDPGAPQETTVDDERLQGSLEADVRLATHLRALSQVSVATAHDIRTPLHTMVLYLELLRNTLAEAESEERGGRQGRYVEVIASELQRLESMLDGLLSQMRIAEGKAQRLDLGATAQELLLFLEPQRRRLRIEIDWEPPLEPVFVLVDKDPIRHALVHLLVSVMESASEGEELRVRVTARGGRALLSIAGPGGIPANGGSSPDGDPQQALLGPQRGLHVARRAIERQHGTLEVRIGASRASTVEIELPLSAAEDR